MTIIGVLKWIARDVWVPRRSCWPNGDGWATYNLLRRTILDTGLTEREARALCDAMNHSWGIPWSGNP